MKLTLWFNIKQFPALQWAAAWAMQVNCWPLMHSSLCCPDSVRTIAGNDVNGDLERQKHCMMGVSRESGWQWIKMRWRTMEQTQASDNIHSLQQMCEKKVWLFGPLSCWSQGYSPPGCYKASSHWNGRLNSNSCALISFRHLFALSLPDVSCLASADSLLGQGPAHLLVLPPQCWC